LAYKDPAKRAAYLKKYSAHRRQIRINEGKCVYTFKCENTPEIGKQMCSLHLARHYAVSKSHRYGLKKKVLDHYGNRCACPGCTCDDARFLTVDHTNNDGAEHRRDIKSINTGGWGHMASWIIKNNYPNTLQILCMNCNCAKQWNGGVCPHVTDRLEAEQRKELQNV
jgi:hypothetical protein